MQIFALAEDAHGFVGADLAALCGEAAMSALRRLIAGNTGEAIINLSDFQKARVVVRPSALREMVLETPKVSALLNFDRSLHLTLIHIDCAPHRFGGMTLAAMMLSNSS